jgi:hypothetical protein
VLYKTPSTKDSGQKKWDPAGSVGVFAGHVIHLDTYSRESTFVWDGKPFQSADLSDMATMTSVFTILTFRCELYDGQLTSAEIRIRKS